MRDLQAGVSAGGESAGHEQQGERGCRQRCSLQRCSSAAGTEAQCPLQCCSSAAGTEAHCSLQCCRHNSTIAATSSLPRPQARKHVAGFKYKYVMIDKSATEIAAVRKLVATGDARGHLLCYFHLLQAWERMVRSAESGVTCRSEQHKVLVHLAHLAHVRCPVMFDVKVGCRGGQGRGKGVRGGRQAG